MSNQVAATSKRATGTLTTNCFCDGADPNCPICHGSDRLDFMPIQTTPKEFVSSEELPDNRCRCGANVKFVFEDQSWKIVCTQGHEGKSAKLPSNALAVWSMNLKRK